MRDFTKTIILLMSIIFVVGCGSTSAVGGAEVSKGDKGSRVGVSNTGDGTEVYGSIRMGAKF